MGRPAILDSVGSGAFRDGLNGEAVRFQTFVTDAASMADTNAMEISTASNGSLLREDVELPVSRTDPATPNGNR